jgi:hypothetical protein
MSIPNSANQVLPAAGGPFTISFWFNPTQLGNGLTGLMGNETYRTSGFRLGINNVGGNGYVQFWTTQSGGTLLITNSQPVQIGSWNQVVVTYSGASGAPANQATIYLNGVEGQSQSGTLLGNANNLGVSYITGLPALRGYIDQLKIYNCALGTGALIPIPSIVTQPASQTVVAGSSVVLATSASGQFLNYQWSKNGQDLAGATNASLPLGSVAMGAAGSYMVTVSNPAGTVASAAVLTVVENLNLVGEWEFDDGPTAKVAADSSGYGNNATLSAAEVAAGYPGGGALSLDGNCGMSIPNSANQVLPVTGGPFTISFWFNPTQLGNGWTGLMCNETYATNGFRLGINNVGGNGYVQFWTTQSGGTILITNSQPVQIGSWNQITIVYTGDKGKTVFLCVNGNMARGTGSLVGNNNNVSVGGGIGAVNNAVGTLSDLRIYNHVPPMDQIQPSASYALEDGPTATVAADSSGYRNNATLLAPEAAGGYPAGGALVSDGVSEAMSIPNSTNQVLPATGGPFTISLWFNPAQLGNGLTGLMCNETYLTSGFRLGINNADGNGYVQFWTTQSGGSIFITNSQPVQIGSWNHVVVTYSGASGAPTNQATVYLNGIEGQSQAGIVIGNTTDLELSAITSAAPMAPFNGAIANLSILDRCLLADDIILSQDQEVYTIKGIPIRIDLAVLRPWELSYQLEPGSIPAQGVLTGTGSVLTYAPNNTPALTDQFKFTVTDGTFNGTGTTYVNFIDSNIKMGNVVLATTEKTTPLSIQLGDASSTYSIIQSPTNGTLSTQVLNGGKVTVAYTPNANAAPGPDDFFYQSSNAAQPIQVHLSLVKDIYLASTNSVEYGPSWIAQPNHFDVGGEADNSYDYYLTNSNYYCRFNYCGGTYETVGGYTGQPGCKHIGAVPTDGVTLIRLGDTPRGNGPAFVFGLAGIDDFELSNLVLDCNANDQTSASVVAGVNGVNCNNIILSELVVSNFATWTKGTECFPIIFELYNDWRGTDHGNILIEDCLVTTPATGNLDGVTCFDIAGGQYGVYTNAIIDQCQVSHITDPGVGFLYSHGFTAQNIQNCTVDGCEVGVYYEPTATNELCPVVYGTPIVIQNNLFTNVQSGVYVCYHPGSTIGQVCVISNSFGLLPNAGAFAISAAGGMASAFVILNDTVELANQAPNDSETDYGFFLGDISNLIVISNSVNIHGSSDYLIIDDASVATRALTGNTDHNQAPLEILDAAEHYYPATQQSIPGP